ncbi:hypothetical protein MKX01_033436 [Papaver californicum]|nr:hypothetical protein MKX01_033436 [Papaver californicum]
MEDTVMELRSSTSLVVKEDHQEKQELRATDESSSSPSCTAELIEQEEEEEEEDRNIEIKDDGELESTKVEMREVRKENERLKLVLARILEDYQSLQKHLVEVVQQGEQTKTNSGATLQTTFPLHQTMPMIQAEEESQLVSLSLGRTTSSSSDRFSNYMSQFPKGETNKDKFSKEASLSLGLDCNYDVISKPVSSNSTSAEPLMIYPSPENSLGSDDLKEDAGEKWQTTNNATSNGKAVIRSRDDEVSQQQQNPVKKPRVSVRTRCETPTMNDGCQWRKYGQKISKGNPCPRAYYRCTVAPGCPVRKQVQRCAEDKSILITTYEGNHSHPLSVSATAMASTTSAAASMLMSGSSTSRYNGSSTTSANLHGLNFSNLSSSAKQVFYIPNSSVSSTSSSNPTITLDLTTPSSSSLSSLSHLNRLSSRNNFPTTTHRYSSTSFNFSSPSFDQSKSFTTLPTSWSNGYLSYGSNHQPYKLQNQTGSLNFSSSSRRTQDHQFYQPYQLLNKNNISTNPSPAQQSLTADTIAAATKALTSDPVFQSALASAVTSIVGAGGSGKWPSNDHQFPIISTRPTMLNGNACGSSYMNVSSVSALASASSSSSQQGMSMFLQSLAALPFSTGTKSTRSGSPSMDDSTIRDHS